MGDAQDLSVRRTVLAGIGAVGVATALVGCGGSGGTGAQPAAAATGTQAPAATTAAASGGTSTGGGGPNNGQDGIKVSDIPVGGGKIFDVQGIVVTQPVAGQFKAFSALCTHQGCRVGSVQGGVIKCGCHGSQFSIVDGSVKAGPAGRPLPAKNATVQGDSIVVF